MPDPSSSSWRGRASALALGDLRRDAFARDTTPRSISRLAALLLALSLAIILSIFCLVDEPALENRAFTYRTTNVRKLPTGKGILAAYCTCTRDPLLWSSFISWPRFPPTNHRLQASAYCAQLRNITGTASLLDAAPVTGPPATPPPPAFNATTAQRIRNNVLQQGCSAWVQDIIISLNPTDLSYQTEAYTAPQLRPERTVRTALRIWLGNKLKAHLQAQYRVAAAVYGAGAGTPLPEGFADLLLSTTRELDNLLLSVFNDIQQTLSYDKYVALCKPRHCDVTATKARHVYVIEGFAKVGGIFAMVLLGAGVLWRLATLMPGLQDRETPYNDLK